MGWCLSIIVPFIIESSNANTWNQRISKELTNTTSRSSYFLLNSASVLDESHSTLYSCAIAFRTFSFDSPDGAFTESFSIIYVKYIQYFLSKRCSLCEEYNSDVQKKKRMLKVPLTVRLTPLSGRNSIAPATNSLPYLVVNKLRRCISSGKSEHLPDAKIILEIASRSSKGHSLLHGKTKSC